jgi:hypothetical protein
VPSDESRTISDPGTNVRLPIWINLILPERAWRYIEAGEIPNSWQASLMGKARMYGSFVSWLETMGHRGFGCDNLGSYAQKCSLQNTANPAVAFFGGILSHWNIEVYCEIPPSLFSARFFSGIFEGGR